MGYLDVEDLSERLTVRVTPPDLAVIKRAAKAFAMEPSRLLRRVVLKALKDLEPEIAKRLESEGELF